MSSICLLLDVPAANLFLLLLFAPGVIVLHISSLAGDWNVPALLVANVVIYSLLAFIVMLLACRNVPANGLKRTVVLLIAPAAVLTCLACFHSLNPLLPLGMAGLSRQENDLQQALPLNIGLKDARAVLTNKGIQFAESLEQTESVVMQTGKETITASAGDTLLSARFETTARQFPCGFAMMIVLLSGPDNRLKGRYINRFPMSP